jgi:very-short-patch-repair endonuclease
MNNHTVKSGTKLSRDLRKRSTQGEKLLWEAVRNRKFEGLKFLRQHPIYFEYINKREFFIADFYCHQYRLVIEIDGKSHNTQQEYDKYRTFIINNLSMEVLRIKNEEIENNIDAVLVILRAFITNRTHPVVPLYK